jgi:hypothetical protein
VCSMETSACATNQFSRLCANRLLVNQARDTKTTLRTLKGLIRQTLKGLIRQTLKGLIRQTLKGRAPSTVFPFLSGTVLVRTV